MRAFTDGTGSRSAALPLVMKRHLSALLAVLPVAAFAAAMALSGVPSAQAADLAVTPAKSPRVHVIRHRQVVLRDYDGTPIILVRFRPTVPVPAGPLHAGLCVTQVVIPKSERPIPYIARTGGCCSRASNSHLYPYARADWPITTRYY
jgi:hypothetical protein